MLNETRPVPPRYTISDFFSSLLGFQSGVDADFCLEEFRDGAAGFRGFDGRVEFGLVRAGNFRDEVQMAFRAEEAIPYLFERNSCRRIKPAASHTCAAQLGGKSQRKSTGVGRGKELLGMR